MPRTVTVSSPAMPQLYGEDALEFQSLDGKETLSELFGYRITLTTPDTPGITEYVAANVPIKQLVGKEFTVSVELDGKGSFQAGAVGNSGSANQGKGVREISGLVTQARFIRSENRRGIYGIVIEPWLTLATRTSDYKIFQEKSVVEILDEVLADYSFPVDKRLCHSYPKRVFQVQYGETDFAFISRLMEEWGIHYFFEHSDGAHRLVLADAAGTHKPFTSEAYHTIRYYPPGHKVNEEYCDQFVHNEALQSGQWVTSDFDFTKPRADLQQTSSMPRNTGYNDGELYQWPGDYFEPDEGRILADIRMEETGAPGSRAQGSGNLRAMVPGCTFTLAKHPQDIANIEYLIIGAYLNLRDNGHAAGESSFSCNTRFEVQPTTNTFRPQREHKKPYTRGPQTAIVTGPAGQEIWTNSYGQVKVSFHWNRYCTHDERSSCWIRVASPWAGTRFGGIHIPRIGQEVIVDFENGDPDRPIIIGRVYNAMNMPPWGLPDSATQSGILTRSTQGGDYDTANALRFEDKKGQEEVWLHAEKDQRIEVENDESHWVGHDRSKTIDHDETNHIKNDRTETVDGHEKITVHKTRTETVDGDETLTVHSNRTRTVGGNESESIGSNKTETIAMAHMQSIGLGKMVNVGLGYDINVGGGMITVVGLQRSDVTGRDHSETVENNRTTKVGKHYEIEVGEKLTIKVGSSVLELKSDGTVTLDCKKFQLTGQDKVNIFSKDIDLN